MICNLKERLDSLDWPNINKELIEKGFVITKSFLNDQECHDFRLLFDQHELFRSTIDMKRYNFGKGMYRYFKYPLPNKIQLLRENIYECIYQTANFWAERTKTEIMFPNKFVFFENRLQLAGQTKSTPLILRYGLGDFTCLHQDISEGIYFPYQVVFGLNESGKDYEGGQFILIQQRPRLQTVPYIVTIPKGAAVIFSSHFHPQKGSKGFYRSVFKHGVGEVTSGQRYTLGLIFHDYKNNT